MSKDEGSGSAKHDGRSGSHAERQRRSMRRRATVWLLASVVACDGVATPPQVDKNATALAVTGEARAALNADGKLLLRTPELAANEIDANRAGELALAYVKTYGAFMARTVSADRGAPIQVSELRRCGDTYYAASPYDGSAVAAAAAAAAAGTKDPMGPALQRFLGPVWLVSLCERGAPAVSVAVSTLASDVVTSGGKIVQTPVGNSFYTTGIPASAGELPMSAEAAVQEAAKVTGHRVTSVPELIRPPTPFAPQLARWRVRIDGKVNYAGKASHVQASGDEVYVGFGDTWHERGILAAHGSQTGPSELKTRYRGNTLSFPLSRKAGYANALELVEVHP